MHVNIRKCIGTLAAVALLGAPAVALATDFQDKDASGVGFNFSPEFANIQKAPGAGQTGGLVDTIVRIINALLVLAAIAAIVFIIIGGVRYITAQGDEDAVEQAKNTIIYAIIGIIVILLAAVIVNFFLAQVVTTAVAPPPK